MKYEAVRANSSAFTVGKVCKALELKTSAYYNWKKRQEKRDEKKRAEVKLTNKIREIFEANKRVYGYRKMQLAISKEGIEVSVYRIRRIMRENGLYSECALKFKAPRKRNPNGRFYENRVEQKFKPEGLNKIWAGDITYIKTTLGWVYLAAVMDLYNREVIGYSISKSIDTELVKRALANALANTKGGGSNTIFHSDRGIQYSSKSYQRMLEENGLIGSMSRSGCPYDNACMESFFSTAKKECIFRKDYTTLEEVKLDMFEYIELFYNRKRMHQTLGYMTPVEYRMAELEKKTA